MTRETGSTTNLYRTGYAYSYASYHRQVVRTEQDYSGGWVDQDRTTYKYDGMERINESQARMPAPLVARGLVANRLGRVRQAWLGLSADWACDSSPACHYDKDGNRLGKGRGKRDEGRAEKEDARSGGEELCFEPSGPPASACTRRQIKPTGSGRSASMSMILSGG